MTAHRWVGVRFPARQRGLPVEPSIDRTTPLPNNLLHSDPLYVNNSVSYTNFTTGGAWPTQ